MPRFYQILMAMGLAAGMFSSILISPSAALADKQESTGKQPAAKAQAKATPAGSMKTHAGPALKTNVHTAPIVKTHTAPIVKTHTAPVAKTHTAPIVKTHVMPVAKVRVNHAPAAKSRVVITKATVVKLQSVSASRLRSIAESKPMIRHVTVQRTVLEHMKIHHAALRNVTFLTGTVIRRSNGFVVLREPDGDEVPIAMQNVFVNRTVFIPGTTVVVPAQFINGGFVLEPAFTNVDEEDLVAAPAVAPCAINDHDGDDVGDNGYYAPAVACYGNDGDADDGYPFAALPASFGVPTTFTNGFVPTLTSGFVVTQAGSNVILMTPNFTPLVVNASAALATGATNGPLTPGRYVTVYGYNVNNTLVATTFM